MKKLIRQWGATFAAFLLAVSAPLLLLAPKVSAMPTFQMPFPCGETWHASTYSGHSAIDWNAYPSDEGSTVAASASGTAVTGYDTVGGYYVVIDHGAGWKTYYGHLQDAGRISGNVNQGAAIGKVGGTGQATGPHLHWEQRFNNVSQSTLYADGSALSPGPSADTSAPKYTSKNNCTASGNVTVKQVKKTVTAGVQQVYSATAGNVFESWWVPGGSGIQTSSLVHIPEANIVDFDKTTLPSGTQSLYVAVSDGIYEAWWNPTDGLHYGKIINLANVKKVLVDNYTDNGQFTHRLYVLASDGPYEYWWRDGGDGIHKQQLANINDSVAMVKTNTNGVEQVYTANAGAVYETWWVPGQSLHTDPIINIAQNDIVDIDKHGLADGTQLLYTATANNGVWQSAWGHGSLSHGKIVNSLTGIRKIEKRVDSSNTQQLYVATSGLVQEYWWNATGSGGSTLLVASNINAIDKTVDGSNQQLYTATGPNVLETWWGNGSLQTAEIASFD